ncbi:MAG: type IV secretory system conjugative DNA transfer family protein [Nitrosomonas sp.]|nr:type IV secretory system conjugative DNA transfer family protein [Nitrosomonas sp.]
MMPRLSQRPSVSRTKQVVTMIVSVLAIMGGLFVATQMFARTFGFNSALGENLGGIYLPWKIISWYVEWGDAYQEHFIAAGSYGLFLSSLVLLMLLIVKQVLQNSSKQHEGLYGSARWAQRKDIEEAGLLPKRKSWFNTKKTSHQDAVFVGAWQDEQGKIHYLKHSGAEHVLCYAPTRSGKGVGLVIPTLLSWTSSVVITDLKGELWSLTSGWRKHYARNKAIRFEPTASDSACWNPLDEIRLGTNQEVGDVQNLATLIVDPDGRGLVDHWQKTAQALLVGLILHVLYKTKQEGKTATLSHIDALLSDVTRDIGEVWAEMTVFAHNNNQEDGVHPVVSAAAKDMLDRPPEEAGSVLSSLKSYLSLYRDPVVEKTCARSDFRIRDLMHHESPVSLYIVTHPNDKTRLRPLIRIMLNMIVRVLADKISFVQGKPVPHYRHRLLLMLDEFPSLGRLEILQESLAFLAGYGIKAYLICQDINQLKSREVGYGHDESITSNCHIQNAFAPNRIETAEHLSKLTGQATVIKEQITTSGNRIGMMHKNVTRTLQETQRALMTPDECMRMPGAQKNEQGEIERAGDMIVYVAGYPAIYGKQPLYFLDEVFLARVSIPPLIDSDRTVAAKTL